MPKYQQLPQTVEAMQWTGLNWHKLREWFTALKTDGHSILHPPKPKKGMHLAVLQTPVMRVDLNVGDWIICNDNGAVFMANDETFQERYVFAEEVLDPEGGSPENPMGD